MIDNSQITLRNHDQIPFVMLNREVLHDKRISLKAKGLLAYLIDKPSNWEFTLEGIIAQLKESRDAIRNGLKELQQYGYLEIIASRHATGRFAKSEWIITQFPKKCFEDSKNVSEVGFSTSRDLDLGKPPTSNTHIKKYSLKKKAAANEAAAAPKKEIDIFDFQHPVWNGDKETYEAVKALYIKRSQSKPIDSKEGWVKECLLKGWHLEKANASSTQNDSDSDLNYEAALQIERRYQKLPQHPMAALRALKSEIQLTIGGQAIRMPSYSLPSEVFKAELMKILKERNLWEPLNKVKL